jgi:hypothetical protein
MLEVQMGIGETYRARYVFKVKEYPRQPGAKRAEPFLVAEPFGATLPILDDGSHVGFDLPSGTSYQRAQEIAEFLNRNLTDMTYTHLAPELAGWDPQPDDHGE